MNRITKRVERKINRNFVPDKGEVGENVIILTEKCNQDCIFCSAKEAFFHRTDSLQSIQQKISKAKIRISLEGGEPTLCKDLIKWVKKAKKRNIKEIILCTNGIALANKRYVKDLKEAGVNLFNINFPSHREKLYEKLTQRHFYKIAIRGIKNVLTLGLKDAVRLTFIINSLNYKTMLSYAKFVKKNFPGVFYVEFNLIKVLGYVKRRKHLVPKLSDIEPYLQKTMEFCKQNQLKIIIDGIPLCFMKGYEEYSIDLSKLINRGYKFSREKAKTKKCRRCSLDYLCFGPRRDYLEIYGEEEMKPFVGNPREVMHKIQRIIQKIGIKHNR